MNGSEMTGNSSRFDLLEGYIEFRVAYYISVSALWALAFVGLVCNLLAFVTICMIRPFTNASFFVALLAILDTCVLLMKLLYQQLTAYAVPIGNLGCSMTSFLGNFVLHFSTWTLVTMTVERFVAVWFPLRVTRIFTMFRARLLSILMGCFLVFLNIHFLWTYEIFTDPNTGKVDCRSRQQYNFFEKQIWYWLNSCVYAFFPCGILILLNAMIIYGMRKSAVLQKQMTNIENRLPNKFNQQKQITIMLVTVSIAFVCFLLPVCIFYLISAHKTQPTDLHSLAQFYLTKELVLLTAELNHVCNIFFYFFSSKKFRSMLIKLLTLRRRGEEKQNGNQYSMYTSIQRL